jgi:uncharacterized membrane protein YgcG
LISDYCYGVIVFIPSALSLLSFFIKLRFPFKHKQQFDQITVGIGHHMLGRKARDPISQIRFARPHFSDEERVQLGYVDAFPGCSTIELLLAEDYTPLMEGGTSTISRKAKSEKGARRKEHEKKERQSEWSTAEGQVVAEGGGERDVRGGRGMPDSKADRVSTGRGWEILKARTQRQAMYSGTCLVVSLLGVYVTYGRGWLEDNKLSVVPVLLIICFGSSLTATLFHLLRYRSANQMTCAHEHSERTQRPSQGMLRRALEHRRTLDNIKRAQIKVSNDNLDVLRHAVSAVEAANAWGKASRQRRSSTLSLAVHAKTASSLELGVRKRTVQSKKRRNAPERSSNAPERSSNAPSPEEELAPRRLQKSDGSGGGSNSNGSGGGSNSNGIGGGSNSNGGGGALRANRKTVSFRLAGDSESLSVEDQVARATSQPVMGFLKGSLS